MEVAVSVTYIRDFCKLSLPEEVLEDNAQRKITTRYVPLGVTVGLVPWNYPMQLACHKLAPALLTGNAFIWKPSPFGPYCALKMAELGQRFFPHGVLQALSGDDSLGPLLTEHPGVNMVSFTGSTPSGKKVLESCSKTVKRATVELGGNDPAIVCADVDPVYVGTMVALIAFFATSQICIAVKRVYVHEAVYDAVLAAITGFAQQLKMGLDETSFMGPVSNKAQYEFVKALLADCKDAGLKVVSRDADSLPSDLNGYFIPPTVIDNPPEYSRIVTEEQFGKCANSAP